MKRPVRRNISIALVLAGLCALALFVLVQCRAGREKSEAGAQAERQNAEQLRQKTAGAQACIDGIARRDPAADAARDIARGDPTPVGISTQAHDPPEIATRYPGAEACRGHVSDRRYEATGKWMTHTFFGFDFMGPPNGWRCEEAARRYATAYNARLSALAPQAVARFCRRRTP